jgi:acylphosphatase
MGDLMKIKITITGKVHDVGYRPFLLDLADSLFIQRFDARNVIINGKQAVIVLVDGKEDQVNQFIELVKSEKPENAIVEEIKVEEYKGFVRSIDSYRQSLMVNQLNKIVQVGLKMLEKQDLMLQKQDLMLQKQDETLKEIKEMKEELREGIKEISSKLDKTNELLERRFEKLEEEIERIKKALIKAGIEF